MILNFIKAFIMKINKDIKIIIIIIIMILSLIIKKWFWNEYYFCTLNMSYKLIIGSLILLGLFGLTGLITKNIIIL